MELSVGEALKRLFNSEGWNTKLVAIRIKEDWKDIVGATIANNTESLRMVKNILMIECKVAILKHELLTNKPQLISKINTFYKSKVIEDIRVV